MSRNYDDVKRLNTIDGDIFELEKDGRDDFCLTVIQHVYNDELGDCVPTKRYTDLNEHEIRAMISMLRDIIK